MSRRSISSLYSFLKAALPNETDSPGGHRLSQDYLTGLRGLLVIESFVWLWLQTFVPTVTSNSIAGPLYQVVIHKALSVLFWDQGLIFSFFVVLSARTCCIHFLHDPSSSSLARSLITRPLRVGIPISVALGISLGLFASIETSYIEDAHHQLNNPTIETPLKPATSLAAFNSIYNLLWVVRDFPQQAGNQAWPSKTIWGPSLIYFQTYTVYIAMVILPFTRASWHMKGLFLFTLGSFWFNSWGWFSATGLLIADLSLNPVLQGRLKSGREVVDKLYARLLTFAVLSMVIGLSLKYLSTAAFTHLAKDELVLHPSLDGLSGDGDWHTFDTSYPYPRLDNYLVVFGTLLLLELSEWFQAVLSARLLILLGRRSLSIFVAQSLVLYTFGLRIFQHLHTSKGFSIAVTNGVVLIALLPTTLLGAEIFYRLVDSPCIWLADAFYQFLTK